MLNRMLERQKHVTNLPAADPTGIYLHLGCGPNIFPGFINVDKYDIRPGVTNWDLGNPLVEDNSVSAMYSSHSLEHLNIRDGIRALRNWYKAMKPGGVLYLAVPDLKEICVKMSQGNVPHIQTWWIYTLFGYQAPTESKGIDVPDEPGQYHMSGYTPETIRYELETVGFTIKDLFTYDGYGTPSIFIEAVK